MGRRYLLFIEADSDEDARNTINELLSLPRPISTEMKGPVSIDVVDVTERIVNQPSEMAS